MSHGVEKNTSLRGTFNLHREAVLFQKLHAAWAKSNDIAPEDVQIFNGTRLLDLTLRPADIPFVPLGKRLVRSI